MRSNLCPVLVEVVRGLLVGEGEAPHGEDTVDIVSDPGVVVDVRSWQETRHGILKSKQYFFINMEIFSFRV